MTRRTAGLAVALAALAWAAPARAGDPIMPLSQVHRGMHCTGYSVVQGTDISSFHADVIDVVSAGASDTGEPAILIEASGPAVDSTGIGEGFSGSPIYCPDDHGVQRNAGAIAFGVGDYGNRKALVTPIEAILGESVNPPRGGFGSTKVRGRVRALRSPLTITGLSAPMRSLLARAGRRAHRVVLAAPAAPGFGFPRQVLRPGSSMAVGLSSGDIETAAIGTVAYTDGNVVWGFGHPLDAAGPRSLLLQDAYVYDVINNPIGTAGLETYKLAAPGHDVGTLTNDALDAVVGRVGPLPSLIPVTVRARDLDTGRRASLNLRVTDESALDLPSSLGFLGPVAVDEGAAAALHAFPPRQAGSMCLRITLRERRSPLRFCNTYAGPALDLMFDDTSRALDLVLGYKFARLHLEEVRASLGVARGLRQVFMVSAHAPSRVRPGERIRVRLRVRVRHGRLRSIRIPVRVPQSMPPGPAVLTLSGTPADSPPEDLTGDIVLNLGGGGKRRRSPQSLGQLAQRVAHIHRFHGVRVAFRSFSGPLRRRRVAPLASDPTLRISGRAATSVFVAP